MAELGLDRIDDKGGLLAKKRTTTLFSAGKARWLLENVKELSEDERALLLAMAELGKDTGRKITDEEQAALDRLAAETSGFDAGQIQAAVDEMVTAKATHKSGLELPSDIRGKIKRSKKK